MVEATQRPAARFNARRAGRVSLGELDASVRGWINDVRYADSWGPREHVLGRFVW